MTALSDACGRLHAAIPCARALLTRPDVDGSRTRGKPGSKPPWNSQAANACMDAHAGLRHLEAAIRTEAGLPARLRGGSTANTLRAIEAIDALGPVMTADGAAEAARILDGWVRQIEQLPAIDTQERWQRTGAPCPYCRVPDSLRVALRSGRVTCIRYGACADSDDAHPVGRMDVGRLDGSACVTWNDGLVT